MALRHVALYTVPVSYIEIFYSITNNGNIQGGYSYRPLYIHIYVQIF